MAKAFFTFIIVACIASLNGATICSVPDVPIVKRPCVGYTVIEAGRGVDCNGDTVKLVKKHGFYELAVRYTELADAEQAIN